MNGLLTPEGKRWHYAYDAFGRRISKRCETVNRQNYTGYDYLWSGDQLIEETPVYADGTPAYDASIQWLYAPDALTPTARSEKGRLHYVVSDHMGTPRELLTEDGNVVWANRLSTWGAGNLWRRPAANDGNVSCNLRFAGQYADEESGLHYNRHRYYDSETGQYLSSDPIGLAGGLNPYGYVHNPLSYIDPLGLACCPPKKVSNSNLPHTIERAVERGIYPDAKTASDALKGLGKQIEKNGWPAGTIRDTANADRVLVPTGNNGMVVYQIAKNGTAKIKTVLIGL
jgi:RHS repeat-associated protein